MTKSLSDVWDLTEDDRFGEIEGERNAVIEVTPELRAAMVTRATTFRIIAEVATTSEAKRFLEETADALEILFDLKPEPPPAPGSQAEVAALKAEMTRAAETIAAMQEQIDANSKVNLSAQEAARQADKRATDLEYKVEALEADKRTLEARLICTFIGGTCVVCGEAE